MVNTAATYIPHQQIVFNINTNRFEQVPSHVPQQNGVPPPLPPLTQPLPVPQDVVTKNTGKTNPILEIDPNCLRYHLWQHGHLASTCGGVADIIPYSIVHVFGRRLEANGVRLIPAQSTLTSNGEAMFFWAIPTPRYAHNALRAKEQGLFDFLREISVHPVVDHHARFKTDHERAAELVQLEQVRQTAQFTESVLQEAGHLSPVPLGPPLGVPQSYHIAQNEMDMPIDHLGVADLAEQIRKRINTPITDILIPELRPPLWPLPPTFRSTDKHKWPWIFRHEMERDPVATQEAVRTQHPNSLEAIANALRSLAITSQAPDPSGKNKSTAAFPQQNAGCPSTPMHG